MINREIPTAMNHHAITEELLEVMFSVVRAVIVATQRCSKYAFTIIKERCLLRGPFRDVITGMLWGNLLIARVLS
jgi:hypothetical protein